MTTEITQEKDPGIEVPGEVKPQGSPGSKYEEQARAMGWVPEDEWVEAGHDPEDHRSAKEFVERDSLYKRIKSYSNRTAQLERQLAEQAEFQAKIFETARAQALADLEAKHSQAVEDGDVRKANELAREMTKQAAIPAPQANTGAMSQAEFDEWKESNSWYQTDKIRTKFADQAGAEFAREYIQKHGRRPTTTEVLEHVDKEVKESFKEERPRGPASPAGATNRRSGGRKTGLSRADLSDVETMVMDALIKSGDITEEKYLKNLEDLQKRGKR